MINGNFSFVIDGVLAGMARPCGAVLAEDLGLLREQGIGGIVTLTLDPLDARALQTSGFRSLHLPVADFSTPTLDQVESFLKFVDDMQESAGESEAAGVAVHCGAGMGRTGTLLACYLVHQKVSPAEAIERVRMKRPGSVETLEQEDLVFAYASRLSESGGD